MIDENIAKEKEQLSTSLSNDTKTTTEPIQSSFHDHSSDIIFTNKVRAKHLFIFFSIVFTMLNFEFELTLLILVWVFCVLQKFIANNC